MTGVTVGSHDTLFVSWALGCNALTESQTPRVCASPGEKARGQCITADLSPSRAVHRIVIQALALIAEKCDLTLVPYMLPSFVVDVFEYLDRDGKSPFATWFDSLNAEAAAKVTMAVARLRQGNFSKVKGAGSGVLEHKIDFGPGYRIYLGRDGDRLLILLGGGSKKRQSADINLAVARWQDYKTRKKEGER